jgi:hypothetical protein
MTAEACRHAVEHTPGAGTVTLHVPLSKSWVVEGLHGPVDTLAAARGITLVWDVYCARRDGRSAPMERARKIAQLGNKTLVVCRCCHEAIHTGRANGPHVPA